MAATGTKLSQHGEKRPFPTIWREQGENYHGQEANNPSRENFLPQTTTHQPHRAHTPVQNSPSNPRLKAKPVQNSPNTAKNAHFRPFGASREKIITARKQTTQAGRTFYRKPPLTSRTGHTPVQNSPGNPRTGAHTNAGGRADSLSARPPGHQATLWLRASRRRA